MLSFLGRNTGYRYTSLFEERNPSGKKSFLLYLLRTFAFFSVFTFLLGFTYLLGKRSVHNIPGRTIAVRQFPQTFEGNESFIGRPTPQKIQAWHDLFPSSGGFFIHPELAPKRSVFSAFHQLHCLENIWHQWWTLYDAHKQNRTVEISGSASHMHNHHGHAMINPSHVNHCIELLRNTLTCHPDLTIEEAKVDTGGVMGFGTEHTCRDWSDMLQWTRKWDAPLDTVSTTP